MDIFGFLTTLGLGGIIGSFITNYLEKKKFVFETVHQDRVKSLIEFYRKISKTESSFQSLMSLLQKAGELSREEKTQEAAKNANELVEYFRDNKIYLNDTLEEKINNIQKEFKDAWNTFHYIAKPIGDKIDTKEWIGVWNKVSEGIPKINKAIKREVQEIIGIDVG